MTECLITKLEDLVESKEGFDSIELEELYDGLDRDWMLVIDDIIGNGELIKEDLVLQVNHVDIYVKKVIIN